MYRVLEVLVQFKLKQISLGLPMIKGYVKNLIILAALIIAGILLQVFGFFDAENMLLLAREYADHWWLVIVLILGCCSIISTITLNFYSCCWRSFRWGGRILFFTEHDR